MRIAYVVPGLDPFGPILVVKSLVEIMQSMGHDVSVYYLKNRITEMRMPCRVHKVGTGSQIDFENYDIVHTHCFSADRYVGKLHSNIHGWKWVSTIHQNTFEDLGFIYSRPLAYVLSRYWLSVQGKADAVVAITDYVKNVCQKYINAPLTTIYNGINVTQTAEDSDKREDIIKFIRKIKSQKRIIVGTYANIIKRKGIIQVFRCMVIDKSFDFVIIGDGKEKKSLMKAADRLHLTNRVHFFSNVRAPYQCLSDMDIYIVPSYSEGFCLSLVEAAAMGVPIVCSNIPPFHELFDKNDVAFFELDDAYSMSNAIHYALGNRELLSVRAFERSMLYGKDRMGCDYLKLYESLLSGTVG